MVTEQDIERIVAQAEPGVEAAIKSYDEVSTFYETIVAAQVEHTVIIASTSSLAPA